MKTQFEQMMNGLNDVEAFLAGKQEGFKAHVPLDVDVKAIRNRLGMTQAKFSDTFGFSLDAIKHWEGGRRTPEAPARWLYDGTACSLRIPVEITQFHAIFRAISAAF